LLRDAHRLHGIPGVIVHGRYDMPCPARFAWALHKAWPQAEFHYELTGPSGQRWSYGPADATDRITGSAEDFCLLVTRRRHRSDLDVTAAGEEADHWMDIAQCYRGPAGAGRRPGQFAR